MRTLRTWLSALTFASALSVCDRVQAEERPANAAPAQPSDPKASFRERGRVGVMGAITEDMWKGGLVFQHEHFEVQLLAHAAFESGDSRDINTSLKVGGRLALGTLNYVALGAEYETFLGSRVAGRDASRSFSAGPYLSLQRYFAATPVMLNLWVCPVYYDHQERNGVPRASTHAYRLFQSGGFGLAYLFF